MRHALAIAALLIALPARAASCTRVALALVALFIGVPLCAGTAGARDDGRYSADPAMHAWFDKLASGRGLCCSVADGRTVDDPDWGTLGDHYWVIVDGERIAVPPEALVTEPNRFGAAVVWPVQNIDGETYIRCFMPGTEG